MLILAYIIFAIYTVAMFYNIEQCSGLKFFVRLLLLLVLPTILLIVFWSVIFVTVIFVLFVYIFGREFVDDFTTMKE